MPQKQKSSPILNLTSTVALAILFDLGTNLLFTPDYQQIKAQSGIQVRTNQWLRVDQVTGHVTYRNLYNYANRRAKIGDRLEVVSDEISTGENSSAILSVDTAVGSIYLTENTTIKIRSFAIAPDNGRITNLFVPRGKARMQIRKFTHRGSQLNIQTPAGVSGVRGTEYIVVAHPNGNMVIATITGTVASTAKNRTEMIKGGFQNLTVVGQPPSSPVTIIDEPNFSYSINKKTLGTERSILFVGSTSIFNTVKVNGVEQLIDRSGKFVLKLPATSNLTVNVKVETPLGKVKVYEIAIL
jgi:hypothetical protein